jgi:hypothetical protein
MDLVPREPDNRALHALSVPADLCLEWAAPGSRLSRRLVGAWPIRKAGQLALKARPFGRLTIKIRSVVTGELSADPFESAREELLAVISLPFAVGHDDFPWIPTQNLCFGFTKPMDESEPPIEGSVAFAFDDA